MSGYLPTNESKPKKFCVIIKLWAEWVCKVGNGRYRSHQFLSILLPVLTNFSGLCKKFGVKCTQKIGA